MGLDIAMRPLAHRGQEHANSQVLLKKKIITKKSTSIYRRGTVTGLSFETLVCFGTFQIAFTETKPRCSCRYSSQRSSVTSFIEPSAGRAPLFYHCFNIDPEGSVFSSTFMYVPPAHLKMLCSTYTMCTYNLMQQKLFM